MGSIISYYVNSRAMQELEDYMNSYNYFDFDDKNSDDKNSDDKNSDDKKTDNITDYYKLLIYIHNCDSNSELKNMYEESSKKHNEKVNNYLYDSNFNDDNIIDCYDSGFDLFCPENIDLEMINMYMLDHNISCAMTYKGKYVGYYLYMRLGTPINTPLRLANNVGIIDSGYRGAIKACFDILHRCIFKLKKGNRYVQICPPNIGLPMKVVIVDSIKMLGENK